LPCTSCAKSNTECVYPNDSSNVTNPSSTPITKPNDGDGDGEGVDASGAHAAGTRILLAVPEATLLQPKMMLTLSKDVFMNRSAEFPSHWLHWSHYTSELATEPSIYRTAFNDFHRLAISVTKRLVQTAIIQATSRLRAQRLRGKKGLLPFVKTRDIYTAIDVLGMNRNGSERWRGVARRCGLRVFSSKTTPKGKRRREVPWSEVERIMSSATSPHERSATETETSAEPENFRSRAVRSGTPLPMHCLAVSESGEDFENADIADDSDSDDLEHFTDDELLPSAHHTVQGRDDSGRYTSVPPTTVPNTVTHQPDSLEEFDQEASRQEERAIWDMLSLKPASEDGSAKTDDDLYETDLEMNEKVATVPGDWRQTIDYCPAWEKHKKQVPAAKFISNQKSPSPMPATHATRTYSTASPSGNNSDVSSTSGSRRPARKPPVEVELRARGTNAYAALQRNDPRESYNGNISESSSDDNEELEKDIPAPSIETQHDEIEVESPGSDMDWT
jgi:RNA polymerase I-specific transcription initiation factor RRN5